MRSAEGTERLHHLDALRASTMLLLVPVHAASLLSANGHEGAWAVAIYWTVHVFRLPLFFSMSGFFLALLVSKRGVRQTARNRTLRIALPLGAGLLVLIPLMVAAGQQTGVIVASDGKPSTGSPFALQPSFLWFLWYLLILDGVAMATWLCAPGLLRRAGTAIGAGLAQPFPGLVLLAIPTTIALWPQFSWTAATESTTFVPSLSILAYYALFFGLGATLCAHRYLLAAAARNAWRWLGFAVAATLPAALLFTLHNSPTYGSSPVVHGAALLIYALATWASLLALIGLATRYLNRPKPRLRYLADASYWIYLSHMPLMVPVLALLAATSLGLPLQFAIVTASALALSLLTYALCVRYSVIGRVLNGPRRRPERSRSRSQAGFDLLGRSRFTRSEEAAEPQA
ncbi:MAG TPA: acyltransferase family protein [Solirubrobacterales bacterium]|nr:acyltransferase family protein [Solirubrobacterales bacterium]